MILEIILVIIILVLGYTVWAQMRKVDTHEDLLSGYEDWIAEFIKRIDIMDTQLKEIDSRGTFESDDEVGTFFKSLKDLQNRVTTFIEETTDAGQTIDEKTPQEKK